MFYRRQKRNSGTNAGIILLFVSLALEVGLNSSAIGSQEPSDTRAIAFTKNVVVKKYKKGEVHAEPYTVEKGDNLWTILVEKYGIEEQQFYFFCRITKNLNPSLRNAHELFPQQVLLIPFKYVPHFAIPQDQMRPVLEDILSKPYSQLSTEEYTITEGEHLAQVLRDVYNIPDEIIFDRYLTLVKRLNPEVVDLNIVKPQQKILLPSLSSSTSFSEEKPAPGVAAGPVRLEEKTLGLEGFKEGNIQKPVSGEERLSVGSRHFSHRKGPLMSHLGSLAELLQGTLQMSGALTIPLVQEGQITIDTRNFPVLQLTDRKKLVLDWGGRLPREVVELLQQGHPDFEVITFKEGESITSVVNDIVSTAGFYSVDKEGSPLVVGDTVQFEIVGDWIIYRDETLKDIVVVNILEESTYPLASPLRDYLRNYGVDFIDLYMSIEEGREKVPLSGRDGDELSPSREITCVASSDLLVLIDSLLALLGQECKKEFSLRLLGDKYEGFDVEVVVDRYLERKGRSYVVNARPLPEKLVLVMERQGVHYLHLASLPRELLSLVTHFLDFLAINYEAPHPRFAAFMKNRSKVELLIPGVLITLDDGETILLTTKILDRVILHWLWGKRVKVIRLEEPT